MSDRCHVKIIIGGTIPRSLVSKLAKRLEAEGLVELESGSVLSGVKAYENVIIVANGKGPIEFERNDVAGGHFEELTEFLETNKLCYKEISDALSGCWDAEMVVYRPEFGHQSLATDSNETVYVPLLALQAALANNSVERLVDRYASFEAPLPPITIIG